MAAGHAVVVALVALTLGALLNADGLAATAERQPFGWRRTAAVVAVRPLQAIGDVLRLDRPRKRLAAAFDTPHAQVRGAPGLTALPVGRSRDPVASDPRPPTPRAPEPRGWGPADPLRLLIAGDSLVEQYGPALAEHAAARAPVVPTVEFRYSSGLTRPDYFDWPAHLRAVVDGSNPDAVVLMFGANDAQNLEHDGTVLKFGSPAWQAAYRRRVGTVMTELARDGRTLLWTGQPVMRSDAFGGKMRLLNDLYRQEAQAHPGVTYLDSWALFAGSDGRYVDYPGGGGPLQRMADGIHLTRAGGERLAAAAYTLLAEQWGLPTPA
jgi:hypothetical protein